MTRKVGLFRRAPPINGRRDRVGDGREANPAREERLHGDLVRGVQDGPAVASGFGGGASDGVGG